MTDSVSAREDEGALAAVSAPHTPECDDDGCYCPDDVFWGRLLGDNDPCAPGKDCIVAAFGPLDDDDEEEQS